MKKKNLVMTILQVIVAIFGFFLIYAPIFIIFLISFTDGYSFDKLELIKDGNLNLSFVWFRSLFSNDYSALNIASRFWVNIDELKVAITNTFLVTILSTIISTILGTFFAIGINSFRKKYKTYLITLNNIPVVSPDIVTGFLLLMIFVLFENLFNLQRGFATVLISHIYFSIPYVVLSVLPRLNQIDKNTYDAARDLGCSRIGAVIKVIIPSIATGILTGMMFAFTMSIDDFVITMFTSGKEFMNVSTWIDAKTRRGFIPKTVYSYNVIIFTIAIIVVFITQFKNKTKKPGERSI